MPRALLKTAKVKNLYLQKTEVENLFINEFLPTAPGEYVKVYLFGLMYAQNGLEMDVAKLSRIMKIREEDILSAWNYWAKKGLLKIWHNNDNTEYEIEYTSLMEDLYGRAAEQTENANREMEPAPEDEISKVVNMEIKAIFGKYESLTGRMLSVEDAKKIGDAITTYSILPDIMSFSVDYCVSEDKASVNQIIKTAIHWAKEGCQNLADVKEYIASHGQRITYYNLIFNEMGFTRLPNPPDREIMDRWFDEMGFTIKEVLEACKKSAGIREPSLRYVNKVLENKKLEQGGIDTRNNPSARTDTNNDAVVSKKVLKEYYEFIRNEGEKEFRKHHEEVYREVLELRELIDLENSINNEIMAANVKSGSTERKKALREQRRELDREKRSLLVRNGYSGDYLDRKYKCNMCRDTGFTDEGKVCSCTKARAQEALEWNKTRI